MPSPERSDSSVDPLSNVMWRALNGPLGHFAEGGALARRFDPTVSPFAGLPDDPDESSWSALRDLVGPGRTATLFRQRIEVPATWEVIRRFPGVQLVAPLERESSSGDERIEVLGDDDVPAMLELATRTAPGPFLARTHELGTFLGVKEHGRLIAMAGQRARIEGFVEISAVCTDERSRGQGLASLLVAELVAQIAAQGGRGFLHAAASNEVAISLYERLGFTRSREVDGALLRSPA